MKSWPLSPPIRVQPFTGLVIDVDTWATAHDYHRRHHQLHLLALHGSGIASGLEIAPADPASDVLVVEPGVAIDETGNVIIVPERQRVTLEASERTSYILLDYVESLPQSAGTNGDETRGRMVEDFRLRVLSAIPETPSIELARVCVVPQEGKLILTPARRPAMPEANEVDARFRPMAHTRAPSTIRIGLIIVGAPGDLDPSHLIGVNNWLRELSVCGLRYALFADTDSVPAADLLYVTGNGSAKPSATQVKGIAEQLKRGAWLFADACGPGTELIEGLKGATKGGNGEHDTENRALSSPFVFGQAPKGASTTQEITWSRNAIISPRDFGCAWAGRRGNQPLAREQIRNALEFGVNVAVCASERRT
jgi:hypothetical protein